MKGVREVVWYLILLMNSIMYFAQKIIAVTFVLLLPLMLFGQLAEVESVTQWCNRVGGTIEINILDDQVEDYTFYWSHSNSQDLTVSDLEPGIYYFFIENKAGCSQTLIIEIIDFTSCTSVIQQSWDDEECVFNLEVVLSNFFGIGIDPEFINVEWNIQNLSGAIVTVVIPDGQKSVEICYEYGVPNAGDSGVEGEEECCTGEGCLTLTRPPGPSLCEGPSGGCGLKINEVFSKEGESFVEFVVTGGEEACDKGCDFRNVIIDDNNGDLIKRIYDEETYTGKIDEGYIRLNNNPDWSSVPVGALIVLHEDSKSDVFVDDPGDSDGDQVYSLWIRNDAYLVGFTRSIGSVIPFYEYDGFPVLPKWEFIDVDLGYDGLQVRQSSERSHALALGYDEINTVRTSGTIPIQYDEAFSSSLSVILSGGAYDLSDGYIVSEGSPSTITPGASNTVANETFIETLRDCGKSKALFAKKREVNVDAASYGVFPNPTNGNTVVTIVSPYSTEGYLVITSASGQMFKKEPISVASLSTTLNMPASFKELPAGLYFIDLILDGQSIGVKKIVLTK
jgi:hypothetical protein